MRRSVTPPPQPVQQQACGQQQQRRTAQLANLGPGRGQEATARTLLSGHLGCLAALPGRDAADTGAAALRPRAARAR